MHLFKIKQNRKDTMKNLLTALFTMSVFVLSAQTIESTFQQTRLIKASGKSTESNGKLQFQNPDKLNMTYTNPVGDYFIIDGKTVKINLKGKKATIDTDKNAAVRTQKNTLLNCIKGNWQEAASDNNADFSSTDKGKDKIITITAKKASLKGYSKITLTYRKADNMLTEMILEEFNGIVNTYKMSNISKK